MSQSFLDVGSIWRILDGIMALCWQLAALLEQDDDPSAGPAPPGGLDQIAEDFAKRSNSLYTILRSPKLAGSQRAPFLRQFLLRLNYNSFFEVRPRDQQTRDFVAGGIRPYVARVRRCEHARCCQPRHRLFLNPSFIQQPCAFSDAFANTSHSDFKA
jgi:hypothetical protein